MKKLNFYLGMCSMVLFTFLLSCTKDGNLDPDDPNNPDATPTAIQFEGSIGRSIDKDGRVSIVYAFFLENKDNESADVNEAFITVNGKQVTLLSDVQGWLIGCFQLNELPVQYYANGANYTVILQYQGKTYTETLQAPGGWSTNAGVTSLSWSNPASLVNIDVYHQYGSCTYTIDNIPIGDLTSPHAIPTAKAYPTPGTYQIVASVQNFHQGFDKLVGWNCRFWINDTREWVITK